MPDEPAESEQPTLADGRWLAAQLDAGCRVVDIARRVDRTPRAVRYALRRLDIATPRARRVAAVDLHALRQAWESGLPMAVIAARFGITPNQVQYRVGGFPRPKPKPRRSSVWPELNDPAWLRIELALGATTHSIAHQLGCDRSAVRAALRRHRIDVPAASVSQLERIEALENPSERAAAAERVERAATETAKVAMRLKVAAQREARRAERPVGVARQH